MLQRSDGACGLAHRSGDLGWSCGGYQRVSHTHLRHVQQGRARCTVLGGGGTTQHSGRTFDATPQMECLCLCVSLHATRGCGSLNEAWKKQQFHIAAQDSSLLLHGRA